MAPYWTWNRTYDKMQILFSQFLSYLGQYLKKSPQQLRARLSRHPWTENVLNFFKSSVDEIVKEQKMFPLDEGSSAHVSNFK